jgi:predicted transcriptional regulator
MDEYVKMALEIVKAQASVRYMTDEEITSMVQAVAASLRNLDQGTEGGRAQGEQRQQPAADPKNAVREKSVICLECGKSFKVLSKRHLTTHGMTPQEYKEKWGYRKGAALIAKSLARQRRKKMREMQLWKRRETA